MTEKGIEIVSDDDTSLVVGVQKLFSSIGDEGSGSTLDPNLWLDEKTWDDSKLWQD